MTEQIKFIIDNNFNTKWRQNTQQSTKNIIPTMNHLTPTKAMSITTGLWSRQVRIKSQPTSSSPPNLQNSWKSNAIITLPKNSYLSNGVRRRNRADRNHFQSRLLPNYSAISLLTKCSIKMPKPEEPPRRGISVVESETLKLKSLHPAVLKIFRKSREVVESERSFVANPTNLTTWNC